MKHFEHQMVGDMKKAQMRSPHHHDILYIYIYIYSFLVSHIIEKSRVIKINAHAQVHQQSTYVLYTITYN